LEKKMQRGVKTYGITGIYSFLCMDLDSIFENSDTTRVHLFEVKV
jgi:hypothetical protein